MKQQAKLLFVIYAVVALLELLFIYTNQSTLRWFTKPMLMPLLMLGFYVAAANRTGYLSRLILAALFLSWCGDVLLQLKGFFIPGLVAFLLAHVCYVVYFLQTEKNKKGWIQLNPLIVLPVFLYILLFLYLLFPYLGALKIPVIVYGITIGTMLLMAMNTKDKLEASTSSLFITGALLFVISDSVLAVNLFAYQHLLLSLLVMATYAGAQYLIVKAAIKQAAG